VWGKVTVSGTTTSSGNESFNIENLFAYVNVVNISE
jgi:hypothetical protein